MTYQEFVRELINRFGEDRGVLLALRAEVGFLRKYIETNSGPEFMKEQEAMIGFLGLKVHGELCAAWPTPLRYLIGMAVRFLIIICTMIFIAGRIVGIPSTSTCIVVPIAIPSFSISSSFP